MRRTWQLLIPFFVLVAVSFNAAQESKQNPTEVITIAKVLTTSVTRIQHLYGPLADAMPEEKYGFAPSNGDFKGVRTFAEQLKHVAASISFSRRPSLEKSPRRMSARTKPGLLR
jgi:hypothetical protein